METSCILSKVLKKNFNTRRLDLILYWNHIHYISKIFRHYLFLMRKLFKRHLYFWKKELLAILWKLIFYKTKIPAYFIQCFSYFDAEKDNLYTHINIYPQSHTIYNNIYISTITITKFKVWSYHIIWSISVCKSEIRKKR